MNSHQWLTMAMLEHPYASGCQGLGNRGNGVVAPLLNRWASPWPLVAKNVNRMLEYSLWYDNPSKGLTPSDAFTRTCYIIKGSGICRGKIKVICWINKNQG